MPYRATLPVRSKRGAVQQLMRPNLLWPRGEKLQSFLARAWRVCVQGATVPARHFSYFQELHVFVQAQRTSTPNTVAFATAAEAIRYAVARIEHTPIA